MDDSFTDNYPYVFQISGSLHHRIGSIAPPEGEAPRFAQIYFHDPDINAHINRHMELYPTLDQTTMATIHTALLTCHPYIRTLKTARELMSEGQVEDLSIRIIEHDPTDSQYDRRTYNAPTSDQVAVFISGPDNDNTQQIVLRTKAGPLQTIDELNPAYNVLAYPLFGRNYGFQRKIAHSRNRRNVTIREFYAYCLHKRPEYHNFILLGGRLFHQWVVDQYAKYEQNNLRYMKRNQDKLRADVYQGLEDVVTASDVVLPADCSEIGKRIVLPSSFVNGPRYMQQLFQDAMAIV